MQHSIRVYQLAENKSLELDMIAAIEETSQRSSLA
jgi:hypothetical protein